MYITMKAPMLSERDNVIRLYQKNLEGNKKFFKISSIDDDRCPQNKQRVRMYMSKTGYLKPHETEANRWNYTEIDFVDVKGHFPPRLYNMTAALSVK